MSPRQLRAVALGLAALLLLWFASELLSNRSELITGQNGPAFGTLYVRKPGDTRVFLWRGRSLPGPTSRVDDWRDKRIAGVEPDSVRALEIARGKERYALERRDRRWTLAGRGPADSAAVTRLLEQYRRVAAVGFATPPQADSLRARRPSRRATLRGTSGRGLFALVVGSPAGGTLGYPAGRPAGAGDRLQPRAVDPPKPARQALAPKR